ncbi:MAG: oxidoreductase [Mycobacterium sp.]
MGSGGDHAVAIGGSLAGLCAARVLADFYDKVTVYERDEVPDRPEQRSAVPQGRHVHLLMARGADEFDNLFPGILADLVAAGVPKVENRSDALHFGAAGHVLGVNTVLRKPFTAYIPSRPQLEWQIRRRTAALPNVELVQKSVAAPSFEPGRGRVTGVRLDNGDIVPADLVIDATGRGTRLPVWLEQWGYRRPAEDTVDVGISYATHRVRIPDGLLAEKIVVFGASRSQPHGLGMLFYEDGIWALTTFGVAKAAAPTNFDEMCALADRLLPRHVAAAIRQGEPVGDAAFHKYPASRWRRYDKLDRFPDGILPLGDAVASFNPTYGQGMTMTSLQARRLRELLADSDGDLSKNFRHAAARITFPVWHSNAIGDHILHGASGKRPPWYRPVGNLFDQFLAAAETEPVLAEWFLRRFSLLDSLYLIPSPRLVGRTIRHNARSWLAERRTAKRTVAQPG